MARGPNTPMISGLKLSVRSDPVQDVWLHRTMFGAFHHASITWLEIAYNVNRRLFRYLEGILEYGLHFRKSPIIDLTGFGDADWASNPDDRWSALGCVYFGSNLVSSHSKK